MFEKLIGVNPRSFWDVVHADDPKFALLGDLREIDNWQDRAIPYVTHGDKAQFTNKGNQSLLSIQWKSLLAEDSFGQSMFLLTAIPSKIMLNQPHNTDHKLWETIVHLFNAMFDGTFPNTDHKGKSLETRLCAGQVGSSREGHLRWAIHICLLGVVWRPGLPMQRIQDGTFQCHCFVLQFLLCESQSYAIHRRQSKCCMEAHRV